MIGKTVSRYKILALLGRGGMGEVYLAEDTELGRKAALKFLPPQYISDPELKARFKREARAAASLNHPNIITIYDIGEHQNHAWTAMELVDGESLRDLMIRREPEIGDVIDMMMQACEGLGEAHRAGIIHRDVKPANILLDRRGRVKIADFGLARIEGVAPLTKESLIMGTPAYMSPEQVRGKPLDARSDIFSLGVVLYELLTRRLPFKGDNELALFEAIKNQQPEPLARYKAGVSPGLQRIIDKALDKELETRYRSAEDLLVDLKREKRQLLQPAQPTAMIAVPPVQREKKPIVPPSPAIKPRRASRRPLIITATALALIVLTYLIVKKWSASPDESATPVKKPAMTASDSLYRQYKNAGDASFNRNDFDNAIRQYRLALQQRPNDRYATAWIDSCDRKIALKNQAQRDKLYAQYVKDGNNSYQRGQYDDAKNKFEKALEQRPGDGYVARKIQECNRLLTPTQPPKTEPARAAPADMVLVQAGTFKMGSENDGSDEKPVHEVYVDAFYMDLYEVTVGKFKKFVEATGYQTDAEKNADKRNWRYDAAGNIVGSDKMTLPVIYVSWNDATEYGKWLSRTTGAKYRLPTEAEWEYAARGGHKSPYEVGKGNVHIGKYQYAGSDNLDEVGWYDENSNGTTHPVAAKKPNELGLYDMSGNVYEWCRDWHDAKYYDECKKKGTVKNPEGPETGSSRVLRGGSWYGVAQYCRSADRYHGGPDDRRDDLGFRLVFVP